MVETFAPTIYQEKWRKIYYLLIFFLAHFKAICIWKFFRSFPLELRFWEIMADFTSLFTNFKETLPSLSSCMTYKHAIHEEREGLWSTMLMVARLPLNLHNSVESTFCSLCNLYFVKSCGYCHVGDGIFKRVDQTNFTYIVAWLIWLRIGYIYASK